MVVKKPHTLIAHTPSSPPTIPPPLVRSDLLGQNHALTTTPLVGSDLLPVGGLGGGGGQPVRATSAPHGFICSSARDGPPGAWPQRRSFGATHGLRWPAIPAGLQAFCLFLTFKMYHFANALCVKWGIGRKASNAVPSFWPLQSSGDHWGQQGIYTQLIAFGGFFYFLRGSHSLNQNLLAHFGIFFLKKTPPLSIVCLPFQRPGSPLSKDWPVQVVRPQYFFVDDRPKVL
jgi:hypothetical protein